MCNNRRKNEIQTEMREFSRYGNYVKAGGIQTLKYWQNKEIERIQISVRVRVKQE